MNIKKIYPAEWRKMHPDGMRADSDQYFAGIANSVAQILAHSGIDDAFPDGEALRDAAMILTGYFEDICTGLGLWKTVVATCQMRYGKPLPFHSTTEYYPGEPNLQDVQLLLWDIIQSTEPDRFINPENPGIAFAAGDIYGIFDREYDDAPDTPELVEYLHDDGWQAFSSAVLQGFQHEPWPALHGLSRQTSPPAHYWYADTTTPSCHHHF